MKLIKPRTFVLLTVFVCLLVPSLLSQQAPVFRSRIDLVDLDVSVLDRNRNPIRGLAKADFIVLEDGKPQQIAVFEAIDVPDPEPPPVAWMRDVTPDVTSNEARVTRLWVIVLDDAMIPLVPYAIQSSKQIVRDIVDKFGPDDLATIVLTTDSRQAQDFTNDRTKLLATLEKYHPGNAGWGAYGGLGPKPQFGVDADWQFQTAAVLTLRNVMDALVTAPHQRKNLVWISPGIPHDFIVAPEKAPLAKDASTTMGRTIAQRRIVEIAKEVFETGRRANVPVYPIDPCGLGGVSVCLGGPPLPPTAVVLEFLQTTALNTGGHAIINTNDFTPGIDSIFRENGSYYSVGYYPANAKNDGTFRRLEVKVNREGAEVRTRSSYYAPKPDEKPPATTKEELVRAMAAPIAVRDLPLRATAAPFVIPGKAGTAAVAITVGVVQPADASTTAARIPATTELRVTAFTTEGDNKGTQQTSASVMLRGGRRGDTGYDTLARLELPPGRFRVRVAAHQEEAARTGTVMVDVIVPDYTKEVASMSGVIINVAPGRPAAPLDALRDVVPLAPTAQREFEKFDIATALFALYQNGTTPAEAAILAIRITDVKAAIVVSETQTIAVGRFGAPQGSGKNKTPSAAEVRYRLPLDKLASGPHLLTFEATIGATTMRRDVQFSVK